MGSKPKKSEYKPSETEKTQAAIAKADADYFRQAYDPLLVEMRDKAATENIGATLRGRAGADTMQALTGGGADYSLASDVDSAANLAIGATGQMLGANVAAKDAKTTQQVGVLGTARGQAADSGDALAAASRLARSEGLSRAKRRQDVRLARQQALVDIGIGAGSKMTSNVAQTGDPFTSSIGTKVDPKTKTYLQGSAGPFGMNQTWKPHPMHSVLAGSGQNFNTTYRGGYNRLRGS